jgi:hypothetical protein
MLSFKRATNDIGADIEIKFLKNNHGDDFSFDGIGGAVAHAFYPGQSNLQGDIHLDLAEIWGKPSPSKFEEITNLKAVLLHEIGHALGLGHSSNKESVMYAWYNSSKESVNREDIAIVSNIYGPRTLDTSSGPIITYNLADLSKLTIENSKVSIYPKIPSYIVN